MPYNGQTSCEPGKTMTLRDLNLRPPPPQIQSTICGKVRSFQSLQLLEWIYIVFSYLALATCLGLTIYRLLHCGLDDADFTFAMLLLLTIVFCCYYVGHAVFTERGDELLVFVLSTIIVLIYCIVNYVMEERTMLKYIRLVIVCVISPFLIIAGTVLSIRYCRSNRLITKTLGNETEELQKACRMLFICYSTLNFSLQLQISMLILVVGHEGDDMSLTHKIVLGIGVILTAFFFLTGRLALQKENVKLLMVFYILSILEPVYVVYKFYCLEAGKHEDAYESSFACGVIALLVWLALIVFTGYFASHYFGIGLKERRASPEKLPASAELYLYGAVNNEASASSSSHSITGVSPFFEDLTSQSIIARHSAGLEA